MPVVDHAKQFQLLEKITPLLIVCIFALVWGASYYLFFQHELQKYLPGGLLHQQTITRQIAERMTYLENLKKFSALYEQYGTNLQSAYAHMASLQKDIPAVFQIYEQMAYKHNLGLQFVDIASQDINRKDASGVKEMVVTLKLANVDYAKLKNLLADIETNARLIDVQSFDFDPETRALSLNVKMYYFAEKK